MQVLEQGSGEPRVSRSALIELTRDEKGVERPGSLSSMAGVDFAGVGGDGVALFGTEEEFAGR